ncbi:Non-structural maintenance of chromosome element 3 [Madurella mycetomatis]|uniref:Non-structural maintenance of chromosome element 3 n=1 Tax=Madurella mycetomatis TaxID=100816 RepID=A0A175WI94_9PEZI|nr:Non-structural maintenance of chromosome element 3 [Madurella mycetomatis]
MPAVSDDDDEDMQSQPPEADYDSDERMEDVGQSDETSQLIKNLVRYALACEYSRTLIRRNDIRSKVLGSNSRLFRKVFAGAQKQLRATFGMEMVELPTKDRSLMTTEQKRKAAKSQGQKEPSSDTYVLVSVLPERYASPAIIAPSKVQSPEGEASYIALYSMIISIITLSGGELSDPRLRRHLTRLNAAENMPSMNPNDDTSPSEKTDAVLGRMIKQGYLVKVTESKTTGDEDSTTWHVGPRGKVEVDKESIAALVRTVYGGSDDELEKKLQVSLKVKERKPETLEPVGEAADEGPPDSDSGPNNRRGERRRQAEDGDEDDE